MLVLCLIVHKLSCLGIQTYVYAFKNCSLSYNNILVSQIFLKIASISPISPKTKSESKIAKLGHVTLFLTCSINTSAKIAHSMS